MTVINRNSLVFFLSSIFLAISAQTVNADKAVKKSCYIEEVCQHVEQGRRTTTLKNLKREIPKRCGYEVAPSSCDMDTVIESCWDGSTKDVQKKCKK